MIEKLTKKQKKGLAFRQKKGKGKQQEELGGDVPVSENLDELEETVQVAHSSVGENSKQPKTDVAATKAASKKRKRDDVAAADAKGEKAEQSSPKPSKRRKSVNAEGNNVSNVDAAEQRKEGSSEKSQRFILFVGNLKYTTAKEAILEHFSSCDPPPTVRLLTPKSSTTTKSKGCAFLEFSHGNALQQALKLHHSELEGREINVELTAGGGGKSEKRLDKVKGRNRELASQRTKRIQKQKAVKGGATADADAEIMQLQRHSSTSGIQQAPLKKRTWSVPDGDDVDTTHRGGRKHRQSKTKRPKALGTGVNSIPVG